jgi:hypothetical protein
MGSRSSVAYALYRMSIGPAVRRGAVVRASIDVHRLEVYEKLGIRKPSSFSDERELGKAVGQLLLYGRPAVQVFLRGSLSGA